MVRDAMTILSESPMFAQMDEASRQRLAQIAVIRTFRGGERIFVQDEPAPGLYVVDTGQVRIARLSPQGREHVLHLCGPGQTFAEVAVLGGFALPAGADAVEPSRCLILPAQPLLALLEQDNHLCRQMLSGMSRWVRHLVSLLEDIVLRDAAGRVARYLLESAGENEREVNFTATKRDVASHLNLTSETFSRVLRRFTDAGLIETVDARRLRLLDRAALATTVDGMYPKL